jgi:outer membrane lipoprotein-sorting protein
MVAGFLGTVIGLERAVAIGRAWAYAAPLATGLGALALATGAPGGPWLMVLGSAVMVVVFVEIVRRQTALFTIVMGLGACAWLAGQALWVAGWPLHRVVFWWAGFLVLTIAGERLELTRLLPLGAGARAAFVIALVLVLAGLALAQVAPDGGVRVVGAALIALAAWLGTFDIARRTVRSSGLTRFIAVALLAGYVWLGVGGLLALRFGDVAAGPRYDAMLHALFVGFVFSMIFGHAPIIFPAVLGLAVTFRRRFYVHLAVLHASLVLRVAGDLASWAPGRQWGGLLNALAIVLFFANTVSSVRSRSRDVAALALALVVGLPAAAAPAPAVDARDIVDRVDRLLRGDSSEGEMTMAVVTRRWTRTLTMTVWSEGTEKALIKVTAPPKEAGTATLKTGNEIWNYLPKIDRTIRVPTSMMMASWMGSHFTNDDLVKDSRLVRDYDIAISFAGARAGVEVWEFVLTPRPEAPVVWGRIVLEVRQKDLMPTWAKYYGDDGADKRTLTFSDYRIMGGRLVPAKTAVTPADKPDESTVITYRRLAFDVRLPPDTFSLAALKR